MYLSSSGVNVTTETIGDLTLTGNMHLPTTNSGASIIYVNAEQFFTTYGSNNIFFGRFSGNQTMTGSSNTYCGRSGGGSLTSGIQNTGYGDSALYQVSSGSNNIGIGPSALSSITTTGENTANVLVGSRTD